MFENFDFNVLSDKDFKEDSVREELILPIIKALGYSVTGDNRIIRSKSLIHPYVAIGSKQRKISIVPDYLFLSKNKPYWILDAKSPCEDIVKSQHVEQAYSYSIHPEIRADLFALCNGKSFALFNVRKFEPILHFELKNINSYWDSLFRILNPEIKADPALLEYNLDYGLYIRRCGAVEDFKFIAFDVHTNFISKVDDNCYTTMTVVPGDVDCLISLDFNKEQYQHLLSLIPSPIRETIECGLKRMPYYVKIENSEFLFGVVATMSNQVIENSEESYVPFIVDEFMEYRSFEFAQ